MQWGNKQKVKDKDKLNVLTREAMIAMGGLGENKWDGLGQCLHTPTILQGDEQLNANCFHHRYQRRHCRHHHERYQRPHIPRIAQQYYSVGTIVPLYIVS